MTEHEIGFGEFVAARWSALYRTAYLLTADHHDAEDLLQGALARTCVRWSSIRDHRAADGYVRRAMVRQMIRQWPARRRELATDALPDSLPASSTRLGGGPPREDDLELRADRLVLWAEIRRLPPRMRATLVLRYLEDLSEEATARELGVSVGSVKSQTHHALRRLRAALPDLVPHVQEKP
jgi:RNA polymerase sigma-70 factor (sigma-E family)